MHLFDYEDAATTQRAFYITTAVASVLTYAVSGVLLWRISPGHSKDQLRRLFRREPKPQSPPPLPTSPKNTRDDEKQKRGRPLSRKAPNNSRGHAPSATSRPGDRRHSTARSRRESRRNNPSSPSFSARRRRTRSEVDLEAGESSTVTGVRTRLSHRRREVNEEVDPRGR